MSAGKAQSACGGILSAEGAIDEYGAALDRNDGISWDIVIIDNGAAIIPCASIMFSMGIIVGAP